MKPLTWIAEVDRDVLRFCVFSERGRGARLLRARTLPLENDQPTQLRAKLREGAEGLELAHSDGFVFVSDRRMVHGTAETARRETRANRERAIAESARELGLWDDETKLAIGWSVVSRSARTSHIAFDAAPRALVDTVTGAAACLNPRRIWVASLEAMIAHCSARSADQDRVALLDIRADHATFVLCRSGRVVTSRRFKLPFLRDTRGFGAEALLPLAMEVTRSVEFLEEQGEAAPTHIEIFGSIREDEFDAAAWSDAFGIPSDLVHADALEVLPDDIVPARAWYLPASLAASKRIPALCWLREPAVPSLLERAAGSLVRTASMAGLLAGSAFLLEAFSDEANRRRAEKSSLVATIAELEQREAAITGRAHGASLSERRATALTAIDQGRLSVSQLCASLSIERPERVFLTRVAIDDRGGATIAGVIRAVDRSSAMKDFGEFTRRMSDVFIDRELGGSLSAALPGEAGVPFELLVRSREGQGGSGAAASVSTPNTASTDLAAPSPGGSDAR